MPKCLRRYYSYETNEVVNEVCEFTKDNYEEKFRAWLGGDYKGYIFDAELAANEVYMYINSGIEDPVTWHNMKGECVFQLINEKNGKEELSSAYIKDCVIFCKKNKQGKPKGLTKSDIEGLYGYMIRYEKKIMQIEIRTIHEDTKNVDGFIALVKKNASNKQEFLNIIRTILSNCNIKIERKVNKLREGKTDMSDTINHVYEMMHYDLKEDGEGLFEEMIPYCQDILEDPEVSKKEKKNYRHILDNIDYVYFHEDDHQMFLSTFLECLELDEDDVEEIPFYQPVNELFIVEEKLKGVDRLLDKGNYIEAQKLYNKTFMKFNRIVHDGQDQNMKHALKEFTEYLQYDLEELQAYIEYKKMLENILKKES